MEGDFDRGYPPFAEFVKGMAERRHAQGRPAKLLHQPLFVKTHEIAPDPALAHERIAQAAQPRRHRNRVGRRARGRRGEEGHRRDALQVKGGTRPDDVGNAPAVWGMSEDEYKQKADVWPLNPNGELVNFTIVESKEGLAKVREIAAVKGIGVLFPGAGTLRGVVQHHGRAGQRVFDEKAWEAAIQQVLAACKEFNVACGYPATATDIEMRMKQGFSVFIIGWGEAGFKAVDIGKKAAGR